MQLFFGGVHEAVDGAETAGEKISGFATDVEYAERGDDRSERSCLALFDGIYEVGGALLAHALHLGELFSGELVDVGEISD